MRTLKVNLEDRSYPIYIGSDVSLDNELYSKHISSKKIALITNEQIADLYLSEISQTLNAFDLKTLVLPEGETEKNLETVGKAVQFLSDNGIDRDSSIIAFGGGVVGDLTGFCAATFLRGIKYIQIPTTLLSQVDSSVGGKTAINVPQGKNLIGSFYNPSYVLISTFFLQTLSDSQYKSGLGEVVKYAFIGNKRLKNIIQNNANKIVSKDENILKLIITESIKTKSKIVTLDEKESGIRAILNFGHTFGHAIEAHHKYKDISHGAAITLGMIIAARVSFYEGHISEKQLKNVIEIIDSLNLNSDFKKYKYSGLKKYMAADKKVSKGKLNLVLIDKNFKAFKTSNFNNKNILKAFS